MIILKKIIKIIFARYFKISIVNFRKIYSKNEFYKVRKVFDQLKSVEFKDFDVNKTSLINDLPYKNIFIKQLVSKTLLRQPFIRLIFYKFYSNKNIIFPIPKEYQIILINNGFNVNVILSTFLWYLFVLSKLFTSILFLFKYILLNFFSFFYSKKKIQIHYFL